MTTFFVKYMEILDAKILLIEFRENVQEDFYNGKITSKFDDGINISFDDKDVDIFTDYLEDNNIKYEMV